MVVEHCFRVQTHTIYAILQNCHIISEWKKQKKNDRHTIKMIAYLIAIQIQFCNDLLTKDSARKITMSHQPL